MCELEAGLISGICPLFSINKFFQTATDAAAQPGHLCQYGKYLFIQAEGPNLTLQSGTTFFIRTSYKNYRLLRLNSGDYPIPSISDLSRRTSLRPG
jgi:hypothetical protein